MLMNAFILSMIACYLFVDGLTGMVSLELGIDIKLSLMFKVPIIAIAMFMLFALNVNSTLFLFVVLVCLLLGPIIYLGESGKVDNYFSDFSFAIKLFTPLLIFIYVVNLLRTNISLYHAIVKVALWFVFAALTLNLLLGVFGFGYKTYGAGDAGLGTTGYFYAGNELGGLVVVTFSFFLQWVWNNRKWAYIPACIFTVFLGVIIATKASALASMIIAVSLPLLNERQYLLKLTRLKLLLLFLSIVVIFFAYYLLVSISADIDLLERMIWAYDEFGVLGLVFSGRQEFVFNSLEYFSTQNSPLLFLFGSGVSGIMTHTAKYSAEVDPVDTLVWFGLIGLLIVSSLHVYFLNSSLKALSNPNNLFAPAIFLANFLLLLLAFFSGHVWTSGMLGISWALLNSLNYINNELVNSQNVYR